jgi:L-amino acid N-acyltransferase YncA
MDWLSRQVRPDDAEAIVGILNPIIGAGTYTVFDTPFAVEAEREYIVGFPERGVFHVAMRPQDERVVGFQSMEPFATYTHAFDHVGVVGTYVDLSWRRKGIASHLFQATFVAAKEKGFEKLLTFIRADNLAAIGAYLHHGFRIIGTAQKQAKINDKYVDEVVVERLL